MFLYKFKYAWLNTRVPSSLFIGFFYASGLPLVTMCVTSQRYELWVIPSGKVCRNVDLRKVLKMSMRESAQALDDLT